MSNPENSILAEALRLTRGARNVDYGHPLDDFSRTVGAINALLGDRIKARVARGDQPLAVEDWPIMMVSCKLSREINAPKRDNRVDGAGYLDTLDMVLEEIERRGAISGP